MPKSEPGKYSVGMSTFDDLQAAVDAAAAESIVNVRASICTLLEKGIYGYAGTVSVVAHFMNGLDMRTLAADEDGHPDHEVRAHALTTR